MLLLGPLALFCEGVTFLLLQEPELVPRIIGRMVASSQNSQPSLFREYIVMAAKLWGDHIAGPILGIIAVASVIMAAFVRNDPTVSGKLVVATAWLTGTATILLVFRAQYDAWKAIRRNLTEERYKNEAAPEIRISLLSNIPTITQSNPTWTATDLFVHLELVLKSPSYVSILDCSLTAENGNESQTFPSILDMDRWEILKTLQGQEEHIKCAPLTRELKERGDPVRGWVHFRVPNLEAFDVQRSTLLIKLKCEHGTCYYRFEGAYVYPDPVVGSMRSIS